MIISLFGVNDKETRTTKIWMNGKVDVMVDTESSLSNTHLTVCFAVILLSQGIARLHCEYSFFSSNCLQILNQQKVRPDGSIGGIHCANTYSETLSSLKSLLFVYCPWFPSLIKLIVYLGCELYVSNIYKITSWSGGEY